MAFSQIVELKVGTSPTTGGAGVGLLISDLNIEFEVQRSIQFSDNSCTITIYNAKETTRNNVLVEGNNVVLSAGYEDESIGTIYIGNIVSSVSVQTGVDWQTTITCGGLQGADRRFDYVTVSLSYAPGTRVIDVLNQIALSLGLRVFGRDNAQGITLPNGYVFAGTAKEALRYCKRILNNTSIDLYIDNATLFIYRQGQQDSRFRSVYLDYNSGLFQAFIENEEYRVGNRTENRPRVKYSCLLNHNLEPSGLVTIRSNNVNGTYVNEKVVFKGGNFGKVFICEGEAIE